MSQDEQPTTGHPVAQLCARLGGRLDAIGDAPLWSVTDADLVDMVRAVETQARRLHSWQLRLVAEATRRDLAKTVGAPGPVPWLAGVLTMDRAGARKVCGLAADLDHGFAATVAAFAAGVIDGDQARAIVSAVTQLPDAVGVEVRARAEEFLLDQAATHPAATLAGFGHCLLETVAPELAEQRLAEQLARAEAREDDRANTLSARLDHRGRLRIRGELDTESWAIVSAALEPLAKPTPTNLAEATTGRGRDGGARDVRSVGQRHADALVELCRRALTTDLVPTRGGFPAHLAVTIDYESLRAGVGVGVLDTGAPISATDVRRIGCDTTVLPVLLGSDGVPLDVGRAMRVFTKELRRAVEIRDIGCAFPGCARGAAWCQVHHILHWINGGPTSLDNAVLVCGHHHRLIHRGGWTVRLGTNRRPEFTPPAWVDPDRTPRRNVLHTRC